jgi:hypothetical protein
VGYVYRSMRTDLKKLLPYSFGLQDYKAILAFSPLTCTTLSWSIYKEQLQQLSKLFAGKLAIMQDLCKKARLDRFASIDRDCCFAAIGMALHVVTSFNAD